MVQFKFGKSIKVCQSAKLKSPPNNPHNNMVCYKCHPFNLYLVSSPQACNNNKNKKKMMEKCGYVYRKVPKIIKKIVKGFSNCPNN